MNVYRNNFIAGYLIFILICINSFDVNAQKPDSTINNKTVLKQSFIPVALISTGIILNGSTFEHNLQNNIRNSFEDNFSVSIDNWLPFIPATEIYIADFSGIISRNNRCNQTKYLFISNMFSLGITYGLKYLIGKRRPNNAKYSFPSGHTAFAFTNATVLYNEFNTTSPVLAYSGYIFAITTGSLRMMNNAHWFSDVLVGAGIGIIVTNLVYYYKPLRNFHPFKKKHISLIPEIDNNNFRFYFTYNF